MQCKPIKRVVIFKARFITKFVQNLIRLWSAVSKAVLTSERNSRAALPAWTVSIQSFSVRNRAASEENCVAFSNYVYLRYPYPKWEEFVDDYKMVPRSERSCLFGCRKLFAVEKRPLVLQRDG